MHHQNYATVQSSLFLWKFLLLVPGIGIASTPPWHARTAWVKHTWDVALYAKGQLLNTMRFSQVDPIFFDELWVLEYVLLINKYYVILCAQCTQFAIYGLDLRP